jgi:hypothetical protein
MLAVLVGARAEAADDVKRACVDANEQAQISEQAGRLREARELARSCISDSCPAIVRQDCSRLWTALIENVPTIIVDARDASGAETVDVRVYVDGTLLADRLDGRELELDPGARTLRFESRDGRDVSEQKLVVKQAEKRRRVAVDFSTTHAAAAPASAVATREPAEPVRRSSTLLPYALGALTAVAGGTFATFAIVGHSKETGLASSCAPRCTEDQVAPLHREYLVANVALAVAVTAFVGTVVAVWVGRSSPPGQARR